MSDYTPTTKEIRASYIAWSDGQGDDHPDKPTWSPEEFDRWFEQVVRDSAARALLSFADATRTTEVLFRHESGVVVTVNDLLRETAAQIRKEGTGGH